MYLPRLSPRSFAMAVVPTLHCLRQGLRGLSWLSLGVMLGVGMARAQTAGAPAQAFPKQPAQERSQAADPLQRDAQRARIAASRKQIAQRLRQQEAACYQRFAVEDCLREVRGQAHLEDNALRKQELDLNAMERREKSAARLRAIEQKTEERNQPSQEKPRVDGKIRAPLTTPGPARGGAPTPEGLAQVQAERAQAARARAEAKSRRQQSHAQEQARKQAAEAEHGQAARQRYEAKQREAQAKRERQRAHAAQNAATRAAPLPPLPPAAPAP